jgi:hypothetical protein
MNAFPFPTDEPNKFPVQDDDYFEKTINQLKSEEYQKQYQEVKVEKEKSRNSTVCARSGSRKHTEDDWTSW